MPVDVVVCIVQERLWQERRWKDLIPAKQRQSGMRMIPNTLMTFMKLREPSIQPKQTTPFPIVDGFCKWKTTMTTMMQHLLRTTKIPFFVVVLLALTASAKDPEIGEPCEVDGANKTTLEGIDSFQSLIGGNGAGCTIQGLPGCYCSVAYNDPSTQWAWQCNLPVGPLGDKECPDALPYAWGQAAPSCDSTLHPTGLTASDPDCVYSTCEDDAESGVSAVCGCLEVDGEERWVCVHSGCSCESTLPTSAPTPSDTTGMPTSWAVSSAMWRTVAAAIAAVWVVFV